ncbi:uncharacterized protein LOC119683739 [Teleopsis dalmanni]|uniref:uncharacterized protein LOC119683739 n=1 Tax=Teleopsis dalmanni TaxID=139649 RepID=UPI0018CD5415|nr:uncharacterized protein LOC119683739 [Teleopsis dalmanni]
MIVFYYSQKPLRITKRERIPLSAIKSVGVQRNCKKLFNYELQVPATPPSNSFGCSILEIAYEILVQAKLKGVRVDHVICAPVIIEQVPQKNEILQKSVMTSSEMNTKIQDESQRNETIINSDVNTTNSALPTYEEATLPTGGKICFEENHYNNENILIPKNSDFEGSN